MSNRIWLHAVVGMTALTLVSTDLQHAIAEPLPDRPIRFIVGFGAGGPTDIVARVLAEKLSELPGRKVIVENRTGASGNIATQAVAGSAADGTTYLIGASPLAVNHTLFPDFPVRFGRDLVGIAPIGATSNVLVVNPSLGVRSLAEFVKLARARPGFITYATVGNGSSSHLAGLAFERAADIKMVPAAYRGGGDVAKDLLGGHVQAWFGTIPSVLELVRAGQLVALAATGPERAAWLPDVPTISELGYGDFDVRLWVGLFAPAGLQADRMRSIEQAVRQAMETPDMKRVLDRQGIAPLAMSRAEFDAFVMREIARWRQVLSSAKN
jgi:tripartite-type tricarboxylate transporter receptor subunit TctC